VFLAVAAAVTTDFVVASSVNDYTGAIGTCPIGAKIKAIFIDYSYNSNSSISNGRMDFYLCKNPNIGLANFPIPGATGGNAKRKFIFLERKGLNPVATAGFGANSQLARGAGWIRIPKRFQNMAEGDSMTIRIGSSIDYNFCIKTIYKWFA